MIIMCWERFIYSVKPWNRKLKEMPGSDRSWTLPVHILTCLFGRMDIVHICSCGLYLVIPLSKWDITPVISGLTLLIPFITGVITHLLSGMSHQVPVFTKHAFLHGVPLLCYQSGFKNHNFTLIWCCLKVGDPFFSLWFRFSRNPKISHDLPRTRALWQPGVDVVHSFTDVLGMAGGYESLNQWRESMIQWLNERMN